MAPTEAHNPASKFALTLSELRRLPPGEPVFVCTMREYLKPGRLAAQRVIRLESVMRVAFLGTMQNPLVPSREGNGDWVIVSALLPFASGEVHELNDQRFKRYAYDPARLGLVTYRRTRRWNDMTCVVRLTHREAIKKEYPRTR